jgi:lycopene cyclase domain-containing protein
MTYFGVLATFLLPPLLILAALVPRDVWRWAFKGGPRPAWGPYAAIGLHVILALVYTTPWDNYLVANGVWWYDPVLVTGITLGYVPIEEYTFFVVQTLLTGLWTVFLLHRRPEPDPLSLRSSVRWVAVLGVSLLWLASTGLLFSGWLPGRYLTLILSWALLPIGLQLAYGADVLLARWRLLLAAIGLPTLYLWLVDLLAIGSGTWTIDPAQTTGLKLGVLPVEEMVFFLVTNVLIGFGITLLRSPASQARGRALVAALRGKSLHRQDAKEKQT